MNRFSAVALILLFAPLAVGQIPTSGNIFVGYSYYNTNIAPNRGGLNGWDASLEGKVFPLLGIVADFSGNYGSLNFHTLNVTCPTTGCPTNISTHVDNVLFGPRLSVSVGKFRPFAEAMVGVAHANTNGAGSDTSFNAALGGGLDYHIFHLLAWRFEGDYVRTSLFSRTQDNVRFSTGIVFRF